ncbi:DCC1-like thiol-disulfide oxidoreductase family protein [Flavobacteriaceae bacterium]|nr:DCC1-like thiol-disulfide oxidoreductase family protein [Flavobacteriaceae bacterium]MDB4751486.1 DCC1-like thiol-disulfide oxidoreductase family protein [Flavobacteriaceae bacterium]
MKVAIILYDGPCVLCNAWVHRLCKWDKKDQLRFATLDSKTGQDFFREFKINPEVLKSVVYWIPNEMYAIEAQATFELFKKLGGIFKLISFLNILPNFITQNSYKLIARNRYRWFGKLESCPLPNPKYAHKFLQ